MIAAMLLAGACAGSAVAATPTVREFSTGITAGSGPDDVAPGPDGNLWFTESNNPGRIAKITPTGAITEVATGGVTPGFTANTFPGLIVAGPDGNLWFTDANSNRIGRITPSGVVTEFMTSDVPNRIAAGPDGNLWFTQSFDPGEIAKITPAGVVTVVATGGVTPGFSANSGPVGIAAGPDGNLWFAESTGNRLGRITPSGTVTEFSAGLSPGSAPGAITAGPDGNLWYASSSDPGRIGKVTPDGIITEVATGGVTPGFTAGGTPTIIVAGPDGNLWFNEVTGNRIGRITPSGTVTEFSAGITAGSFPGGIAAGPDGNLWFAEGSDRMGRITTALDPPRYTDAARIEVPARGTASGPANAYPATIEAAGLQGKVTNVTVRLNGVHHAFASDIEAQLVGPGGQSSLLLHNATNRSGDVTTPGDVLGGQVLTFTAAGPTAPRALTSGVFAPVDGGFALSFPAPAPLAPTANLAVFNGTDPNGVWKLFVADDESSPGTTGVISGGWSLDIATTGPDPVQVPGPANTVTVPGPTVSVPAPADTTKPGVTLTGLVSNPRLAAFRKGVSFTIAPSEPVTLDITLSNPKTGVVLAELERELKSTAAAKLQLKPNARRLGKPKKAFKATLRVVATDKGGNRTKLSRTITVQPVKKKPNKRPPR